MKKNYCSYDQRGQLSYTNYMHVNAGAFVVVQSK